jgi:hypothetical protein
MSQTTFRPVEPKISTEQSQVTVPVELNIALQYFPESHTIRSRRDVDFHGFPTPLSAPVTTPIELWKDIPLELESRFRDPNPAGQSNTRIWFDGDAPQSIPLDDVPSTYKRPTGESLIAWVLWGIRLCSDMARSIRGAITDSIGSYGGVELRLDVGFLGGDELRFVVGFWGATYGCVGFWGVVCDDVGFYWGDEYFFVVGFYWGDEYCFVVGFYGSGLTSRGFHRSKVASTHSEGT